MNEGLVSMADINLVNPDDAENFWTRFLLKLESIYPPGAWAAEKDVVEQTLRSVAEALSDQYDIVEPIAVGGGGVAIRVLDLNLTSDATQPDAEAIFAVLKVARPVEGQTAILNRILQRETERLRELRHQNVMRILTYGSIAALGSDDESESIPYYVMEHLKRPHDADQYLAEHPSLDTLIRLFSGAVDGLAYMHEVGTVHLDIKPANILVSDDGKSVVIGDLGFAKKVDKDGMTTNVGGTAGFKHPDHDRLILEASQSKLDLDDPNREMSSEEVLTSRISKTWDIYALGVTLLVFLRVLELDDSRRATEYRYRYLMLMAHRMIGAHIAFAVGGAEQIKSYGRDDAIGRPLVEEKYLGIRRDAMRQLAYKSMTEIRTDLDKLLGVRDMLRDVPELSYQPRDVVQAASHSSVPFTERIRALLDSAEVRSLGKLDQLGLVRLVYPTASHSRLEHSLGTLAMASRFVRALYSDPMSPIFKQLMSVKDMELLLAVCLVHDIGHYPLAHDLEEVDNDVFSHEERTKQLLTRPGSQVAGVLAAEGPQGWDLDPSDVARVLTANSNELSLHEMVIRSIIDGPIDADKLDYLLRDSENLRLPYGRGVDFEKLVQCLTVVVRDDGHGSAARIGINNRGKIPAESVAFARYAMYGSVYWHRTHRTAKAMLNRLGLEVMYEARRDKPSQYRTKLRESLYEFLADEQDWQLMLDGFQHRESVRSSPYIDAATQRMVMWLAERIPEDRGFDRLADDLAHRRLYKRVLVVSRGRAPAGGAKWSRADAVFGGLGQHWEWRRSSMIRLQERLAQIVSEWDGRTQPGLTTASISEAQEFVLEAHTAKPLVLIDYPPVKTGAKSELEYVQEEEWSEVDHGPKVDQLEPSSMWSALVDQYSEGLGKLRVYVHPRHARVIKAAIPREDLEQATWGALLTE